MDGSRRAANVFVVAMAAAAVGLAVILFPDWAAIAPEQTGASLTLAACIIVAWLFPLDFAFKTKLYLDAGPILVAVLLLPPGLAMLVVGLATFAARALRPPSFDWAEAGFNASQTALQAAVGGLLLAWSGWDSAASLPADSSWQIVAAAAGAAIWVVSAATVAIVAGLDAGLPVRAWPRLGLADAQIDGLSHAAQIGLGLAAVILAEEQPLLGLALAPAVIAVYGATYHHLSRRRGIEAAQREREAGEAAAQRLAAVGSWRWELGSDRQRWSDETFRILGFSPRSFAPTLDVFLTCVHPDDRAAAEAALRQAAAGRRPYALDHRVVRPDGTVRHVAARGEPEAGGTGPATAIIGTLHDVTERERVAAELAYRASHDALTGLPDPDRFRERIARALAAAGAGRSAAVFVIDLDEFGAVNEALGQAVGDRVLAAAAERLRQSVRMVDAVTRLGSDEFAVLVVDIAAPSQAAVLAARVGDALRWPSAVGGQDIRVTASIGIAVGGAGQSDPQRLLLGATSALKRAKAAGGNRCVVFDGALDGEAERRLVLQGDLPRAVERGRPRLRYQPLVDLATGAVVGFDVLPHWHHPEYGVLSPARFRQLAAKAGLVDPVGGWVLGEACAQAALWRRQSPGGHAPRISVHLAEDDLADGGLAARVETAARASDLPASEVELVFPRGAVYRDSATIEAILRHLRAGGIRCVVGDFGWDSADLGSIGRIEVDGVRLGRSLIAPRSEGAGEGEGEGEGERALVVAESLAELARRLGMTVTGEGIGTPAALVRARAVGCDVGQGDLFDPPLPGPEAGDLLARGIAYPVFPGVIAISSQRRKRRGGGADRTG